TIQINEKIHNGIHTEYITDQKTVIIKIVKKNTAMETK
ncbi:eivJ1 domain protein, partial [Escherichia coli P0304777.9]